MGRGAECEWPLPDPQKSLSRKHCKLEFLAGAWQVRDLSVNGTFVNAAPHPIGRNQVQALRDGDRLQLGSYEIEVRVQSDDATQFAAPSPPPWGATANQPASQSPSPGFFGNNAGGGFAASPLPGLDPVSGPEFASPADRFGGSAPGAGAFADHGESVSDAFVPPKVASVGQPLVPDNWWDMGSGTPSSAPSSVPYSAPVSAPATAPVPAPVAAPAPTAPAPEAAHPGFAASARVEADPVRPLSNSPLALDALDAAPLNAPRAAPYIPPTPMPKRGSPSPETPGDMQAALAAFFEGSGLSPEMMKHAGSDPQAALRHAGALLRVAVGGVRALLVARGRVKREFRIEQTVLQSKENNLLKFAASDEQAMVALLNPQPGALKALEDAVNDLNLHQVAVLAATQAASRSLLDRLEPDNIEVADTGKGLRLFADSMEKRLWEAYKLRHATLIEQFEDDFESAFGVAFAKAYEQAVGRERN